MTDQLQKWLEGNPEHDRENDKCCPDFSCCRNGDIAPIEVRERFVKATKDGDDRAQNEMLGMFLMHALGGNVYVAGLDAEGVEQ